MVVIKGLLEKFSCFLKSSWEDLSPLFTNDTTGSLQIDWLQANWELIVEGLCGENVVLECYGDGADCNGASSRVLYPDRIPTHKIICTAPNGNSVFDILNNRQLDMSKGDITFDRFVCIGQDDWYYEAQPFDKILGKYSGDDVVLEFRDLEYQLKRVDGEQT